MRQKLLCPFLAVLAASLASTTIAGDSKIAADVQSAAQWIAVALNSSGYRADFSFESLKEIDRFLDEQAPRGRPTPKGLLSESLGARLFALGSYVGEVIRREAGGTWQGDDADPRGEINVSLRLNSGSTIWPVQRVMKRFKEGPEESIYAYGAAVVHP